MIDLYTDSTPNGWKVSVMLEEIDRYKEVLDYVRGDVGTILDLATAIDRQRTLRWMSSRGKPQSLTFPSGWLTVQEAIQLPLPDTSWMSNPWPRSKFTKWMET